MTISFEINWNKGFFLQMCCKLVSCADFKAMLTPFSEVIWNRYSAQKTSLRHIPWGRTSLFHFISNEIVIYSFFFLRSVIFSHNSQYTKAVAYTMYFELGKLVVLHSKLISLISLANEWWYRNRYFFLGYISLLVLSSYLKRVNHSRLQRLVEPFARHETRVYMSRLFTQRYCHCRLLFS